MSGPETFEQAREIAKPLITRNALRQIPFDQLSGDQKIERMREIIKDLQRSLRYVRDQLSEVRQMQRVMNKHSHAEGRVLIDADVANYRDPQSEAQAASCEGYF